VNRSEDAMIGVRFVTQAKPELVVEDASHWVFTGTGLHNGDHFGNADGTAFLGYEVDSMGPFSPPNTQRLSYSPATPAAGHFSDMTTSSPAPSRARQPITCTTYTGRCRATVRSPCASRRCSTSGTSGPAS
jgi:N,N-dimethylformamidase beta subunit-like, C-terminal